VDPSLPIRAHFGEGSVVRVRQGLGLEEVREPEALGLGRGMHEFVADVANVDPAKAGDDVLECPQVLALLSLFCSCNTPIPDDTIDVELLGETLWGEPEAVPVRVERGDLFAVDEVQWVDTCSAVPVHAHGVDKALQRGILGAVLELRGCIWGDGGAEGQDCQRDARNGRRRDVQSGKTYSRGLRYPKDWS